MKIFMDDGSTNIKLRWKNGDSFSQLVSPNSFKREWSVAFGGQPVFNYEMNGELYSFDPITPDAVTTTQIGWQYSDVNVVAVHHALLQTDIEPCEVDIVVTLPLCEFYDRNNQRNEANIKRKQESLKRVVSLNGGNTFTIGRIDVMPESIPAGFSVLSGMDTLDSLLIVDLGGTTLDVSQVMGKMSGISKIHGDSSIGVSLMTGAVKDALRAARTSGSNYLADGIIINRNDDSYLKARINDESAIDQVKIAVAESCKRLSGRVIDALSSFEGYTHVMVIGGGAELISDDVKNHCKIRADRFFKSESPQFDLVTGMSEIG